LAFVLAVPSRRLPPVMAKSTIFDANLPFHGLAGFETGFLYLTWAKW
jgi:hypothetical protein